MLLSGMDGRVQCGGILQDVKISKTMLTLPMRTDGVERHERELGGRTPPHMGLRGICGPQQIRNGVNDTIPEIPQDGQSPCHDGSNSASFDDIIFCN